MKLTKLLLAVTIFGALSFTGCKPKDADIKTAIQEKLKSNPELAPVNVEVIDGVATLSGEVKEEAAKMKIADLTKDVKGLKSTTDNTTVAAAPVQFTPPVIVADDPLTKSVNDATKDYPGVKATVNDGVIAVTGEITAAKWKKLKMNLDGLHPKKVDGNALTIK